MVHIQANAFICAKSSIKKKYLSMKKVKPVAKFANLYKKQPTRVVTSLVSLTYLKRTCQQKNIILMDTIAIQYRNML